MRRLPKDPNKPFKVNGIRYKNRAEYGEKFEQDLHEWALFLYGRWEDKFQAKKLKEK
ncbi:MAG: hypothetical protein ACXWLH_03495 [Candidatus Saccharimonadales bacterium]